MTLPLGLILLGALMVYCGLKGKSLSAALLGHAVDAKSGSLISPSGSSGAPVAPGSFQAGPPAAAGTASATNPGGLSATPGQGVISPH